MITSKKWQQKQGMPCQNPINLFLRDCCNPEAAPCHSMAAAVGEALIYEALTEFDEIPPPLYTEENRVSE